MKPGRDVCAGCQASGTSPDIDGLCEKCFAAQPPEAPSPFSAHPPLTGGALADAQDADVQAARDGYNPGR